MKTETRERKQFYEVFIADDGKEFKTREECEKYESSAQAAVIAAFEKIPHTTKEGDNFLEELTPNCDAMLYATRISDENDLKVANQFIGLCNWQKERLGPEAIGKVIIIEKSYYDNSVYIYGETEAIKKSFCEYIDDIVGEIGKENENGIHKN